MMRWVMEVIVRRAARWFIAGVFAMLPVIITVAVIVWVTNLLARLFGPGTMPGQAISGLGLTLASDETGAYLIGAVLVLVVVFLIGVMVESGARNLLQRLFDTLLERIPLVGPLYGTSRQLVAMLDKRADPQTKGMKAVFCLFGRDTGAGVLALLVSPKRFRINDRECQIVIVPTAPVPFGGGLLFVPVESIRPTDLSVEALMSIYISMGVTADQFLPPVPPPSACEELPGG